MGNSNSSTKESGGRPSGSRSNSQRDQSVSEQSGQPGASNHADRLVQQQYGSSRSRGGSRPDLSFLHIGNNSDREQTQPERRETKQEREARKAEKERLLREKEREKSLKEEGVDGGYLVTLGVYTGPEDFNKQIVRQLQIERRLAPFWKGLNDHSDSWTEHQLVAAARGEPIPAADEIPPGFDRIVSNTSQDQNTLDQDVQNLMVPMAGRTLSKESDASVNLSSSHPTNTHFGSAPPSSPSSMPLFRGRAKTLASLTTSSRSNSAANLTPQEIQLPASPYVHGQHIEAYLYKDAAECPICFMYYPPYLNKTRCCDQPICSECFVQIKRPDPHPPEHHDDPSNPNPEPKPEEEVSFVSEPSQCPYCQTQEFGVTYEPPPFRRGLSYAGVSTHNPLVAAHSAMSSSTSLGSIGQRRRTTSLSVTDKSVITTDKIRPDWAKKLSDARAHALRRSAAATALHNAAYVLGNQQGLEGRNLLLGGRRRRTLLGGDSPSGSGTATPDSIAQLLNQARREGLTADDLVGGRTSSRRNRIEDLEELMMMEAIRMSLAAEEDRKKKEEKEIKKEEKKKAKETAKEQKKADKAAKKAGKAASLYPASTNESTSTWATTSMARSTSNLGSPGLAPTPPITGKGKAPAMPSVGFNPLNEPTSTLNTEVNNATEIANKSMDDPQKHLEESRANLHTPIPTPTQPIAFQPNQHRRQFSSTSSMASSMIDSAPGSYRNETGLGASPNVSGVDLSKNGSEQQSSQNMLEPMFNFRSLAAMIGEEDKSNHNAQHVEHVEASSEAERPQEDPSPLSEAVPKMDMGESSTAALHANGGVPTATSQNKSLNTISDTGESTMSEAKKHGGNVQVTDASEVTQ
ncbi:hypothetical protein MBLNU457_5848t1 [Dothideomycetes sp. NU457]